MQSPDFWSAFVDANVQWVGLGVSGISGWEIVAHPLLTAHLTIVAVTVFLHRSQAHRAPDLHPVVKHFFRLWRWLSTGIVPREWVAVHRKHHGRCGTGEAPHSPQTRGICAVLLTGRELDRAEAQRPATLERFGKKDGPDTEAGRFFGAVDAKQVARRDACASAAAEGLGSEDLARVAHAAVAGRVATLLIEADRQVTGRIAPSTGGIHPAEFDNPQVDDVPDDLGTLVARMGGVVHVLPAERMPGRTGMAASFRH